MAKKLSLSRVLSASNWTFLGLILLSIIISSFSYSKIFFTLRHQQAQVQGHVQPEQSSRVISVLNIAWYSGTPPYEHPVYKTTSLLRPYSFKPNVKTFESFYFFEDPVNATTSLLRPGFYGPTVVALTGLYKKTVYSVAWIQFAMLACYGPYTILGSVSSLRGYSFEINIANEFCFCLIYLNSCLNPVLYFWKIRDVKQEVKKTISKFLCFWFYLLCLGRSTTRLI